METFLQYADVWMFGFFSGAGVVAGAFLLASAVGTAGKIEPEYFSDE